MKMKTDIKKLDGSKAAISVEIEAKDFETFRPHAISHILEGLELPGFRKGKVPEAVALKHVGEMALLEEMAEHAVRELYPKVVEQEKIKAIGRPDITINKIGQGSVFSFIATTALLPEITLPSYTKISEEKRKEKKVEEVKDEDVEKAIEEIRKYRGRVLKEGEEAKEELPELTDEFVKGLGSFENVEDFKKKVRENLVLEKESRAKEKVRLSILESLISETKIDIPEILVENELDRMTARMKQDIARMGLKFEEYMKHIGKTEADMRKDWIPDAQKRVASEFILQEIATKEKIAPKKEAVAEEVKHALAHSPEADLELVAEYIEDAMKKELTLSFLETGEKSDIVK